MAAKRKKKGDKESSTTYEMGKIYFEGMEEEPQADFSEYEEVDEEDDKAGTTRKLLSSKGAGDEPSEGRTKDDDFLKGMDYDPDENWPD